MNALLPCLVLYSVLVGDHHASARAVQSSCNVTDKRRVIHKALRKKIEQLEHTYSAWCTQIESVMGQVAKDMEAIHIQAMTSKHVHGTSNGVQHKFNTMQVRDPHKCVFIADVK